MLVECYGGHRGLTELLVYIDVFTPFFKINKAGKSYILGSGILSLFMIHTRFIIHKVVKFHTTSTSHKVTRVTCFDCV